MSDVLQIAMKRRTRLKAEITKLEEFLHMAEELSKEDDDDEGLTLARSSSAPVMAKPASAERARPAANGAGGA